MARKAAVRRGRKNNDRPVQAAVVPEQPVQAAVVPEQAEQVAAVPEQTEQVAVVPEQAEQTAVVPEQAEREAPVAETEIADTAPVSGDTEPMRIPAYLQARTHTESVPKRTLPAPDPPGTETVTSPESEIDTVARLQRDADEIARRRQTEEAKRRRAEDAQRNADAAAYRRQAEEEAREREEIEDRRRRVEEEQQRIKERVAREVEERTAAEERRLRREQEAIIEEEVEKRLRQAEEEAVPQIIFSPKMERAKRATVLWIVSGIVVLALVSILLGIRNDRLRRQIAEQAYAESTAEASVPDTAQNENGTTQSNAEQSAGAPAAAADRKVYLTFDDGPSPVTEQILDILKQYDVKATFFVVGRVDEASGNIYRRIVDEGHTLAMHSYTHNYAQIYESLDSFQDDMHKLQNLLYEETGVWCKVFRFPGGSSNAASRVDMDELTAYLDREEITYYDWNVYGGDDISPDIMQSNVFANVEKYDNAIILLHDAADKEETVAALPGIIEYIQGLDRTVMLPITDETIPVQHGGETPDQ